MDFLYTAILFTLAFICFIVPIILTFINIAKLLDSQNIRKENDYEKEVFDFKKKKEPKISSDFLTFFLGITLTIILYFVSEFKDYTEALRLGGFEVTVHSPIASWSMPTVFAILALGTVSYYLIRRKKLDLPPLVIVCAMSGSLICSIYMIIFLIQICNKSLLDNANRGLLYLTLFPINYILCAIRAQIEIMNKYKEKNLKPKEYNNKFLNTCNKILYDIDNWPIISVVFSIPLAIILICILVLFGQRPDEAIKAFLETSDWTLSTKVSPPSVTYDAHYLCTVSLKGHQKIVKPTRMGIRRGEKIVVNRQLCVANAFEDLITEKAPNFHHFVRYIYDKYGFPLSKCIKNAWLADITYILMKPLEYVFLIVLYLFDKKPENRIAMQYTGKKLQVVK